MTLIAKRSILFFYIHILVYWLLCLTLSYGFKFITELKSNKMDLLACEYNYRLISNLTSIKYGNELYYSWDLYNQIHVVDKQNLIFFLEIHIPTL